jgi:hypothetical protein
MNHRTEQQYLKIINDYNKIDMDSYVDIKNTDFIKNILKNQKVVNKTISPIKSTESNGSIITEKITPRKENKKKKNVLSQSLMIENNENNISQSQDYELKIKTLKEELNKKNEEIANLKKIIKNNQETKFSIQDLKNFEKLKCSGIGNIFFIFYLNF